MHSLQKSIFMSYHGMLNIPSELETHAPPYSYVLTIIPTSYGNLKESHIFIS